MCGSIGGVASGHRLMANVHGGRYVLVFALFLFCLGCPASGADLPDFSGKYTLTKSEAPQKDHRTGSLSVVQTSNEIQINRTWTDKKGSSQESNTFFLDGRDSTYTSSGGARGKGNVEFKGESLLVRAVVVTRPDASQPSVEIRMTERWQLSKDSKTLTVHTSLKSPSVPSLDISTTEKYTRD